MSIYKIFYLLFYFYTFEDLKQHISFFTQLYERKLKWCKKIEIFFGKFVNKYSYQNEDCTEQRCHR